MPAMSIRRAQGRPPRPGVLGTFDSLNPFIVKGLAPAQIRGYVIESLLARGYDEPFTLYGLLARSVETDAERSYVTFTTRPGGEVFRRQAGHRRRRDLLLGIAARPRPAELTAPTTPRSPKPKRCPNAPVRFDLTGADDRELPLILGLMPVLPKHAIDPDTFEDTTFEPLIGSGPYVIGRGRRRPTASRSSAIRTTGDATCRSIAASGISTRSASIFTATPTRISRRSKRACTTCAPRPIRAAGRPATISRRCATDASSRRHFPTGMPKGMSGLVFNTRRPIFADIRVREAIVLLFDFEWINHNFFFDRYQRTASYFDGSELSARGRPADARERALLAPFPEAVRAGRDGRHLGAAGHRRLRARSRDAQACARSARGRRLRTRPERCCATARPRKPFTFEFLVTTKEQERLAIAFARDLKRAGIALRVRVGRCGAIRPAPHHLRFRHDRVSLGPVAVAGQRAGILLGLGRRRPGRHAQLHGRAKAQAIDAMIAALLQARERDEFVAAVRALDRVLMSGFYVVPLLSSARTMGGALDQHRASGATTSLFGYLPETWWRAAMRPSVILGDGSSYDPSPTAGPRSTICSGAPSRAVRTRSRCAIRPTGRASPTASRAASPTRRPTASSSAIAGRLRRLGLPTDSVVGLQLPNTVESVLTLLGVLRAGMIAAPLPMLWRRTECAEALSRDRRQGHRSHARASARPIIASLRMQSRPSFHHPLRLRLRQRPARRRRSRSTTCWRPRHARSAAAVERDGNPAAHVALVTFERHTGRPDGGRAQPRGTDRRRTCGPARRPVRTGCARSSPPAPQLVCRARAHRVVPWLLTGGTLSLHQPFDAAAFAEQCREHALRHCRRAGPAGGADGGGRAARSSGIEHRAGALARAGAAGHRRGLATAGRRPGRHAGVRRDRHHRMRRGASSLPAALPSAAPAAPRDAAGAARMAEIARSAAGTLMLRGPMVPRHAFPARRRAPVGALSGAPTPRASSIPATPAAMTPRQAPCGDRTAAWHRRRRRLSFHAPRPRRSGPPGLDTAHRSPPCPTRSWPAARRPCRRRRRRAYRAGGAGRRIR